MSCISELAFVVVDMRLAAGMLPVAERTVVVLAVDEPVAADTEAVPEPAAVAVAEPAAVPEQVPELLL